VNVYLTIEMIAVTYLSRQREDVYDELEKVANRWKALAGHPRQCAAQQRRRVRSVGAERTRGEFTRDVVCWRPARGSAEERAPVLLCPGERESTFAHSAG
jgi:hypothetical protein